MTCTTFLQGRASSRPFLRRAASIACLRSAQLIRTLLFFIFFVNCILRFEILINFLSEKLLATLLIPFDKLGRLFQSVSIYCHDQTSS